MESLRLYNEADGVYWTLKTQLLQAVKPRMYLQRLHDCVRNDANKEIHEILQHLQTIYGNISPHEDAETIEQHLVQRTYDPTEPIETIYNAIKDLEEFSSMAGDTLSNLRKLSTK